MDLDMDMPKGGDSSKLKPYEVEFDTLTQEAVETLIRKDLEHISSIFGISVRSLILPCSPARADNVPVAPRTTPPPSCSVTWTGTKRSSLRSTWTTPPPSPSLRV